MSRVDYVNSLAIGVITGLFIFILIFTFNAEIPNNLIYIANFKWLVLLIFPAFGICFTYLITKLNENRLVLLQFGKFCYVGFSNLMVDFGVLNLFIYYSGIDSGIYYSIFKGTSFLCATVNSYIWNKLWTFNDGNKYTETMLKQFIKFFIVVVIGLVINVAVASIIVNEHNPPDMISSKLWANFGAIVSLIFTLFWHFLGMKFLVFKKSL